MEVLPFKIVFLLCVAVQIAAISNLVNNLQNLRHNLRSMLGVGKRPEKHHTIRIHLDEDEELIVPKQSTIKVLNAASSDKFYADLSKINKEPPNYVRHTPVGKLMSSLDVDDEKNCCGNGWKEKEVALEELFRPVLLSMPPIFNFVPSAQLLQIPQFDDVKPVTEIIEDDLKYDFRTNTHTI